MFHLKLLPSDDKGWIVAECLVLPGCVSQVYNEKEALQNIKESITAWLWADGKQLQLRKLI